MRRAPTLCTKGEEAVRAGGDGRLAVDDHRFRALDARAVVHVAHCRETRVEQQPLVSLIQLTRDARAHETRMEHRVALVRGALQLRHAALRDALREELAEAVGAEHVPTAIHADALAAAPLAHADRALVRAGAEH